jgi:signal transduction histidine kinase
VPKGSRGGQLRTWDIEHLLDDLLAGRPLPCPDGAEPPAVEKLRRLIARSDDTDVRLAQARRALDEITSTLMRIAALDFHGTPQPTTGDDVVDAAHLGIAMMAEELAASQRALEEARDAAVLASRTKSSFLADVSHELRTPLNAIIGYCELAIEDLAGLGGGADQVHDDLRRILRAAHHLLGLISDVLDLSKIEAGRLQLSMQMIDVAPLLEEVADTLRHLANFNGNHLEIDPCGAPRVWADPARLRQVLFNLVGNAAKYTRNGQIHVYASYGPNDVGWIEVADTGVGIDRDQLDRIFQPFVRVDEHAASPGTGLGLAITERLCRMMGGEISVTSELGAGSAFRVQLSTRPCEVEPTLELPCPPRST